MQQNILVALVVVALLVIGAAVYFATSSGGGAESGTGNGGTGSSGSGGSTGGGGGSSSGGGSSGGGSGGTGGGSGGTSSPDISGFWHGTYESSVMHVGGDFCFYFTKSGNGYQGILNISGAYSGVGIPITVSLNDNTIEVGWVAAGATFTGTISGDSMHGTWTLTGGQDHGTWSASKGFTDACNMETEENGGGGEGGGSTGSGSEYDNTHDQQASNQLATIDPIIRNVLTQVFGGCKLYSQGELMGTYSGSYIVPATITPEKSSQLYDALRQAFIQANMTIGMGGTDSSGGMLTVVDMATGITYTVTWTINENAVTVVIPTNAP